MGRWKTSVESSSAHAHACSFDTPPNEKLPSISKNEAWRPSEPMMSMSFVRTHFWHDVAPISLMVFLPW